MATTFGLAGWGALCDRCPTATAAIHATATKAVMDAKRRYKWRMRGGELLCLGCQQKAKG